MGRERNFIGQAGEERAAEYLRRNGYKILDRNFRTPFGELDIVAEEKDSTIFVEVKTRLTDSLGPPYLSVTRKKKLHIIKNALFYLKRFGLINSYWRIDVISVRLNNNYEGVDIEHIENAVLEEEI